MLIFPIRWNYSASFDYQGGSCKGYIFNDYSNSKVFSIIPLFLLKDSKMLRNKLSLGSVPAYVVVLCP